MGAVSEREPTMAEIRARQYGGSGLRRVFLRRDAQSPDYSHPVERYGRLLVRWNSAIAWGEFCAVGLGVSSRSTTAASYWAEIYDGCERHPARDHTLPTLGGDWCLRDGGCTGSCAILLGTIAAGEDVT